jgi:hypothetical protein
MGVRWEAYPGIPTGTLFPASPAVIRTWRNAHRATR